MHHCTQCGHELGAGRFCTNCGHPVAGPAGAHAAWRTDTAERPRVEAPTAGPPPPASADPVGLPPAPPAAPEPEPVPPRHRTTSNGAWLPWVLGLVSLGLVAVLGAWLLLRGGGEPVVAEPTPTPGATADGSPASGEASEPEPSSGAPEPEAVDQGRPTDLSRFAAISAPPPAPASQDTDGDVVRYVASNLVDGSPETCWRMPGDGTGVSITFRFEEPVRLSEIGLINGYAKTTSDSQGVLDWYAGNRRVRAVEWTFDDGTVVAQELAVTTDVQGVELDGVEETESVTLRLLDVTRPGAGRASRDYTAISDVRLVGTTAP